jgi:hypothetical protein
MIRIKPSNIFDFYAPTGGATKIAEIKGSQSQPFFIENQPIVSGTCKIECTPDMTCEYVVSAKKIKWGHWILGGILVIGSVAIIVWYSKEEQKKKHRGKENYW